LAYWKGLVDAGTLNAGKLALTMACAAKDAADADGTNAKAWLLKKNLNCTTSTVATLTATETLVSNAYLDVLGRSSDTAGLAYWKAKIDSGTLYGGNLSMAMACAAKDAADADGTNAKAWLLKKNLNCSNGISSATVTVGGGGTSFGGGAGGSRQISDFNAGQEIRGAIGADASTFLAFVRAGDMSAQQIADVQKARDRLNGLLGEYVSMDQAVAATGLTRSEITELLTKPLPAQPTNYNAGDGHTYTSTGSY
jgi:hypothetical protein